MTTLIPRPSVADAAPLAFLTLREPARLFDTAPPLAPSVAVVRRGAQWFASFRLDEPADLFARLEPVRPGSRRPPAVRTVADRPLPAGPVRLPLASDLAPGRYRLRIALSTLGGEVTVLMRAFTVPSAGRA
jgi:hypothetical protein